MFIWYWGIMTWEKIIYGGLAAPNMEGGIEDYCVKRDA